MNKEMDHGKIDRNIDEDRGPGRGRRGGMDIKINVDVDKVL
jgi:hypothetical protein